MSPESTLGKVKKGEALLVCPYEKADCTGTHLVGAITLEQLESMLPTLSRNQLLIFFCGCPKESFAESRAAELASRGFQNVAVIDGGILGWIRAGYEVTSAGTGRNR